jgi:hypothetical protein
MSRYTVAASDFLHLVYNLVYPAVLGTFLYEMIIDTSGVGVAVWIRRAVVIALYCIDFVLAKKLYEIEHEKFGPWRISAAVAIEVITIVTLAVAFRAAARLDGWYYAMLFAFTIFVLLFYVASYGLEKLKSVRFGIAVCGALVALVAVLYGDLYAHDLYSALIAIVLGLFAVAYYAAAISPGSPLSIRISVGGSIGPRS